MSIILDTIKTDTGAAPETTETDRHPVDPNTGRAYVSRRRARLHRAMANLDRHGLVEPETMRRFDRSCLTPIREMPPESIREIRLKAAVSQAVMAAVLNVSVKTVEVWEAGTNKPSGLALKVLALAEKNGLAHLR